MIIGLEIAKPRWGAWRSGGGAGSGGGSVASGGGGSGGGGGVRGGLGVDSKALDQHVALWMREFDRQGTGRIDEEMFHRGGRALGGCHNLHIQRLWRAASFFRRLCDCLVLVG
jgi:hypothetical protein